MRFAYADPPYPGMGHRYEHKKEVNHPLLIRHLDDEFERWALSTHSRALQYVLSLCPSDVRVAIWAKPFAGTIFVKPQFSFEAVIFKPAWRHKLRDEPSNYCRDFLIESAKMGGQRILGEKPLKFCWWVFQLLDVGPGDELADLFPGSGAVREAWEQWVRPGHLLGTEGLFPAESVCE